MPAFLFFGTHAGSACSAGLWSRRLEKHKNGNDNSLKEEIVASGGQWPALIC